MIPSGECMLFVLNVHNCSSWNKLQWELRITSILPRETPGSFQSCLLLVPLPVVDYGVSTLTWERSHDMLRLRLNGSNRPQAFITTVPPKLANHTRTSRLSHPLIPLISMAGVGPSIAGVRACWALKTLSYLRKTPNLGCLFDFLFFKDVPGL